MSLVALSIDTMLPALARIGQDLGAERPNDAQFVITAVFLGLGVGQILFGPLSDRIGRRAAIQTGLVLFMAGCLVSVFASTFEAMIAGRGLGGLVGQSFDGTMYAQIAAFALSGAGTLAAMWWAGNRAA